MLIYAQAEQFKHVVVCTNAKGLDLCNVHPVSVNKGKTKSKQESR